MEFDEEILKVEVNVDFVEFGEEILKVEVNDDVIIRFRGHLDVRLNYPNKRSRTERKQTL